MFVSALNRKLWRDLVAMRGQALAIVLVVAAGVAMFVMYLSNFDSLRRTQQAFYQRQRFADVFVSLKRAPRSLEERLAAIPGVSAVETRVVVDVMLDVPGLREPGAGRLVSIPGNARPRLDAPYLRAGRWVDPARPDEVLASEAFVEAHGFHPGDRVAAIVNGRRRSLTIVGVALSPEFVYSIPPGEIIPDDRRFGVFWMERRALASAFDMEGGFNDAAFAVTRGASVDAVLAAVDRLVEPYGGLGAMPRALQFSHWTLENELVQLQTFGFVIPVLFLLVAAFILSVAMTRALAIQRPQIAALKALGYDHGQLAWHYTKWALAVAAGGVVLGGAAGAWLGRAMLDLYNQYFRFPELVYRLSPAVLAGASALSLGAGAAGAFAAVRRAVRVPPAEAMRPEPPARYRHSALERPWLLRHVTTAGRMVLRNFARQPWRALASSIGIALAVGILVVGFVFVEAIDALLTLQFSVAERQDVSVSFVEPLSARARHALERLPGVLAVEPFRSVPVRVRSGHRHRTLALTGVPARPELRRIVGRDGRVAALPAQGLVLSRRLGEVLGVAVGDRVTIEVLEGSRPVRDVLVAGLVDDTLGLSAFMERGALHRLMRESEVISGATLLVDGAAEPALSRRLRQLPVVAGVTFKRDAVRSFRETLAQNMDVMIGMNVLFAAIIACGVVYNAARVSLSERSRELASLRVLGFTRAEISLVLLGELAVLTLAALPLGAGIGLLLARGIAASVDSEVYRFPLVVTPRAVAWSFLVIIGAAALSGLIVRRRLDRLDLVAVLKVRE